MRTSIIHLSSLVLLFACAGHEKSAQSWTPYQLGQALVIGDSKEGELVHVDQSCGSEACLAVSERCGQDAYADVVVDEQGHVLDVLCFRGNAKIQEIGSAAVATASAGNDSVLVLDGEDDGADVTGDVVLTGNNAVIYGRGADVSRIGGNLEIDKNNAIVRSVSIQGNVTIDKNNAQLSFTEIHGDLTIDGNNTTIAKCVVFGQVQIRGVNTVLVQDRFAGERVLSGKNLRCNGNVSFEPAAGDVGDAGDAAASAGGDAGAPDMPLSCEAQPGMPGASGHH
jgi:hypothetical protein